MPIFEFKCTACKEFFEIIVMGSDDKEVACPKCQSREFERVVSVSNFAMGSGAKTSGQGVQTQERNCSGGSCKTYTVPGETK